MRASKLTEVILLSNQLGAAGFQSHHPNLLICKKNLVTGYSYLKICVVSFCYPSTNNF